MPLVVTPSPAFALLFGCKKWLKILSIFQGEMPVPVSVTVIKMYAPTEALRFIRA